MKKRFTIILAFLMMVFVGASTQNLLVNGDFDEGLLGWNGDPDNIRTYTWFGAGNPHFALKYTDEIGGWQVVENLTPGAAYKFSGLLRNNNSFLDEEIRAGVRNYGGDELSVSHLYIGNPERVEDEWTSFSIDFTMGAANTSVEVFIQKLSGNNVAYADALVLEPAGVSTSLEDNSISNISAWVANGSLTVTNAAGGELSLLNLTGASVLNININSSNQVVGVSHLPAGVYIVSIVRDGKVFSSKVIK